MKCGPALHKNVKTDPLFIGTLIPLFSSPGVAANHGPVHEVAESNRKRNDAERGNGPDVAVPLDTGNQSESSDVAERSADQQNAGAAGTRRLVQLRLHRNVDSAGNRCEPLFASKPADPVIRIKCAEGDTHPQRHGHQSNQFSAHSVILLSFVWSPAAGGRVLLREPLSLSGTEKRQEKFPEVMSEVSRHVLLRADATPHRRSVNFVDLHGGVDGEIGIANGRAGRCGGMVRRGREFAAETFDGVGVAVALGAGHGKRTGGHELDRKSTRLNSSHITISYAVFCLKKKKK